MQRTFCSLSLAALLAIALPNPVGAGEPERALMGMKIEKADQTDAAISVVSTGAEFLMDNAGSVRCFQRIPIRREIARVALAKGAFPLQLKERNDFACQVSGEGIDLVLQGDSLVILKANKDCTVGFQGLFKPAYHAEKEGRWLFIDPQGGFGIYPVEKKQTPQPELKGSRWGIEYPIKKGEEIWLSVFPPRPYQWQRAYKDLAAHEGNQPPYSFPSDSLIQATARYCNVLVVHSWIWPGGDKEPWMIPQFTFKDDQDRQRFNHMRDEAHRHGMKLIPYCSPYYYSGKDFFGDIQRVLEEYKADGLYFDGIVGNSGDFRRAYETVRKTRKLLGDQRVLFYHCTTDPLGSNRIYCPFVDAYSDYIYRGEAGRGNLELDDFLRWTVSGYNISNAVGYWVYTGSTGKPGYVRQVPSADDIEAAVRNEVRIPRTEIGYELGLAWEPNDGHLRQFDPDYYGKLASTYEQIKKLIGLQQFTNYSGTPAQFLRSRAPGAQPAADENK